MKKNDGRIYFKDQWHDAMYYIFSLDSPLWKTFKGLTTNPGKVGNEYIAGKRKSYYTPIKYFILASAIYFLLIKVTGYDIVQMQFKAMGTKGVQNPVIDSIKNNVNYFLFLLVIILAFVSKLFFPKSGKSYPENVAYSFLIVGHFIALSTIFIPLAFINPIFALVKYMVILYMVYAIFSYYRGNVIWRLIRSFLVVFLSYLIYITIVYTSVIFFYKATH